MQRHPFTSRAATSSFITAVAFALVSSLSTPAHAALGVNLIENPSFEDGDETMPAGWEQIGGPPGSFEYSEDRPRTGIKCLKFHSTAEDWPKLHQTGAPLIPIELGATYRLQLAHRFEETPTEPDSGRIYLRAVYHRTDGSEISWQDMHFAQIMSGWNPPVTETWTVVQGDFTPQTGLDRNGDPITPAFVSMRIETPHLEGVVAMDDISMVQLVNAQLDPPASSHAYDFVETEGEETPGFTPVPFSRDYATAGDYGFESWWPDKNSAVTQDQTQYPTRLQGSTVRRTTFTATLPQGDYRVSLFTGGWWRSGIDVENQEVKVNGVVVVADPRDHDTLMDEMYFSKVHDTLVTPDMLDRLGYQVYDEYIAPSYHRHDFDVTVGSDGKLSVAPSQTFMSAVVVTPLEDAVPHDAAMAAFKTQIIDEFVSHWANYRPPEEFGLPIVQGSYTPDGADLQRGYVVFQRHWMEFVEHNSRPNAADVNPTLALSATPGEYEPATFSIWPLSDLQGVTVTASDLTGPGGATLPASAVRIWYLQQKPVRDNNPATTFSLVSSFLPDWEVRDLFQDVTQRVWLSVKVPEGAAPGAYQGELTVAPSEGGEPTALDLHVTVHAFALERPAHLRSIRGAGSLVIPYDSVYPEPMDDPAYDPVRNREWYRTQAYQDLYEHGFLPEVSPYFTGWFDRDTGTFDWDMGTISGTANDMLRQLRDSPHGASGVVWLDAANMIDEMLNAFSSDPDPNVFTAEDTFNWLTDIQEHLTTGEFAFSEIYLHTSAEESHYGPEGGDAANAWLAYLQYVNDNRDNWPNVYTTHSCNTDWGQPLAIANSDFPTLGMFHGVKNPEASAQIAEAQASGKAFGFYGLRGRWVPGFYHWKAGGSGNFHEFYTCFRGTMNNDWDNDLGRDNVALSIHGENPGWQMANYSDTGRMISSWFWEEIREGVDDDAYMATLDHWIATAAADPRPSVAAALASAEATHTAISDAIDLDVDTTLTDPLDGDSAGAFSRVGLNLYRPITGAEMDDLRSQAAQAITALKTAVEVPLELLDGGGMESWVGDLPEGWQGSPSPDIYYAQDADAHEGALACWIGDDSFWESAFIEQSVDPALVPLLRGAMLRLTVHLKVDSYWPRNLGGLIEITSYGAGGDAVDSLEIGTVSNVAYESFTLDHLVPSDADSITVRIVTSSNFRRRDVLVDGATLREVVP